MKSFHQPVDDFIGVFMTFLSQMQIHHGGFQLRMAEIALDDAQIHAGFQKMRGIGVAQRMNGHPAFFDAGGMHRLTETALNAVDGFVRPPKEKQSK